MHRWEVRLKVDQSGEKWHLSRSQSKSENPIPMRISKPTVNIRGDLRVLKRIYSLHTRYPQRT